MFCPGNMYLLLPACTYPGPELASTRESPRTVTHLQHVRGKIVPTNSICQDDKATHGPCLLQSDDMESPSPMSRQQSSAAQIRELMLEAVATSEALRPYADKHGCMCHACHILSVHMHAAHPKQAWVLLSCCTGATMHLTAIVVATPMP